MTNPRIVRLASEHTTAHSTAPARKKGMGLTETERQLLLAELAEITAELDELYDRAAAIAARVKGGSSAPRLAG